MTPIEVALSRLERVVSAGASKWKARCPAHEDRNPSLLASVRSDSSVGLYCFAGCAFESIVAAMGLAAVDLRAPSIDAKPGKAGAPPRSWLSLSKSKQIATHEIAKLSLIRETLAGSVPARGTLAEKYLRSRGIEMLPEVRRFAPALKHTETGWSFPTLLAPIVDVRGELIGLHRTFLDPDGNGKAKVEPNRMMLGRCMGGAVRLGNLGEEIGIGEGIETSLSAMQLRGVPVWAALSTAGIMALVLPPLPAASRVVIFADNDVNGAGARAAKAAAERWYREGRRIRIATPNAAGTDFNDLLRSSGGARR
jgi:phage/plasmid primase-like uncharacterized protein